MLRYARSLISQLLQTVACNGLHTAEQRVARWILLAADRVDADTLHLTQQAVADVLGLRRATVSEICSQFQAAQLVDYARGEMVITNREGLESRVCDCYRRIRTNMLW